MASGDRTKRIINNIGLELHNESGVDGRQRGRILNSLNRLQRKICQECSAKQGSYTVTIIAGTELYSYPDGFVGEVAKVPSSTTPLVYKTIDEIAEIKRTGYSQSVTSTSWDTTYYYKWNKQFGFVSPSGSAPSSAGTVTFYGYYVPKDDGTQDMGLTVDPIVDSRWDSCLIYGVLAEIGNNGKWVALYEDEKRIQRLNENAQQNQASAVAKDSTIIE